MKRALNDTGTDDLEHALKIEAEATIAGFLDPETTRHLLAFG